MFKRVKILQPVLSAAVAAREPTKWPAYDGGYIDRSKFVSASSIGQCARKVWFDNNATATAKVTPKWGFFERGHSHEAWIVEQLRSVDIDYSWSYIGDEQVSFYAGPQSGTPDGLLQIEDAVYVVDFKSIDPRTKLSALPKPEHKDQIIQNMDLVEHCLDIRVAGGMLFYSDASDYQKVTEFLVDRNSPQVGERMVELEERAHSIANATSPEQVPAEGIYNGGCTFCQFTDVCSGTVQKQQNERVNHDKAKRASTGIFG